MERPNLLRPDELRAYLEPRITKTGVLECWVWNRSTTQAGYAQVAAPWGGYVAVHRLTYLVFVGPLRKEDQIHHICLNRRCCNPDHLVPLSDAEHHAVHSWKGIRNQCVRGHDLTGQNARVIKTAAGQQVVCRLCAKTRADKHRKSDPETYREYQREWHRRNWRKYRDKNPEESRAKAREATRRYRERQKNQLPPT